MSSTMNRHFLNRCNARQAFTLLEVILALAILAGSAAILGELLRAASRNAADVEAETRAQLLANTVMDEMVSGVTEPTEESREPLDVKDTIPWVYSVTMDRTEIEGLASVEVLVEQDIEKRFRPVKFRLVRWIPRVTLDSEDEDSSESSDDAKSSGGTEGEDG